MRDMRVGQNLWSIHLPTSYQGCDQYQSLYSQASPLKALRRWHVGVLNIGGLDYIHIDIHIF
jgi:hypothetical protein